MELFFVIAGAAIVFLIVLSLLLDKNSGIRKLVIYLASTGIATTVCTAAIWLASFVITSIFNVRQLTFVESFGVLFVIILIKFAASFIK